MAPRGGPELSLVLAVDSALEPRLELFEFGLVEPEPGVFGVVLELGEEEFEGVDAVPVPVPVPVPVVVFVKEWTSVVHDTMDV